MYKIYCLCTVKNLSDLLFSSRTVGPLNESAGQDNESLIKHDAETESDVNNNKNLLNYRTTGLANCLKRNSRRLWKGIITSFKDLKMFMW